MERLTYKIGEKYAWTFTRKVFEDLKEAMQELTQKVFDIYGAFFHEVDEILHYGDICRKTQAVDFIAKNAYNKLDKMDKYGRY